MNAATDRGALARGLIILFLPMALGACAGLRQGYEMPTVTVAGFRALPSQGTLPEFAIDLRVMNPNRESLKFYGASYTVSVEGHDLVKGVAKDLPVIEGYSQGQVEVIAAPNLLAGIRLFSQLMNSSKDTLDYAFEVKLDSGSFRRKLVITDSGQFSLRDDSR